MNPKLKLVLGVAVVIVVLSSVRYLMRHPSSGVPTSTNDVNSPEQTLLSDRDSLKKKDVSDYELVGALIRLAVHHDPGVRDELNQRMKSPSKIIRSGVADATGYYDDDAAVKALEILLSDPEETVRLGAMTGLSHRRNTSREKLIIQHLNGKHDEPLERIEAYSALLSASGSAEVRSGALKHLYELVQAKKPGFSHTAAVKMMGLAPMDAQTLHMVRSAVESGTDIQLESDAIRHLAGFDAAWIRSRVEGLRKSPHPEIRTAIVQSMHGICPKDRWLILKSMVETEKDPGVLDTLVQEAQSMPGQGATDYLNWIRTTYSGKNNSLIAAASMSLARLKNTKSQDPCTGQ